MHLFAKSKDLAELSVYNTPIADGFLETASFPLLKKLNIDSSALINPLALSKFIKAHIRHLSYLNISSASDQLIDQIGDFVSPLESLNMEGSADSEVSDQRLAEFFHRFPALIKLNLDSLRGVKMLPLDAPMCQQLTCLEISKMVDFLPENVQKLVNNLPSLRYLTLLFPKMELNDQLVISSANLITVSIRLKHLEHLILEKCPNLVALLAKFPDAIEDPLALNSFSIRGECPLLRLIQFPSKSFLPGFSFWPTILCPDQGADNSGRGKGMSKISPDSLLSFTPNLVAMDCHPSSELFAAIRRLNLPYIMCHNCEDTSLLLLESFYEFSDKTATKIGNLIMRDPGEQLRDTLRKEEHFCIKRFLEGQWRREWHVSNVKTYARLLKTKIDKLRNGQEVSGESRELRKFINNGFKERRFILLVTSGEEYENTPFI